jgi:hypothetical protein
LHISENKPGKNKHPLIMQVKNNQIISGCPGRIANSNENQTPQQICVRFYYFCPYPDQKVNRAELIKELWLIRQVL